MKFNIGQIVKEKTFSEKHYQIIDVWKNVFYEYIYLLQSLEHKNLQFPENEKYLIEYYTVVNVD